MRHTPHSYVNLKGEKMGTWGTGIYSNDIAEDVRDACKDIFALYDVAEGNELLFNHFADDLNQGYIDNEYASFWYALADWQWKHGMLSDFVKEKTLSLLKTYAGIEEWEDAGNQSDIAKRKKVLNSLKNQLLIHQPALKKPKLSLKKPKHTVGEVIVFRGASNDESIWKKESFSNPLVFKLPKISNSKFEEICGYNAQGKYMALLCVGTDKELHSEYIQNVYDEYSVYVWYDYLSDVIPNVKDLERCGFLPFVNLQWEDFNRNIVSDAEWMYKFVLCAEKFKIGQEISELNKYQALGEVNRFNLLFSFKNYSDGIWGGFSLSEMFSVAFEEKNRMSLLEMSIDNLLDSKAVNPEILSSDELKKAYKKYVKGLGV